MTVETKSASDEEQPWMCPECEALLPVLCSLTTDIPAISDALRILHFQEDH